MPKDLSFDVKLSATDGHPVALPAGGTGADAQFMRDGMDLYLASPGGHTVKVEGYFAHDPAPDLVTADGARLSPGMVDAFLPPQHPGEYAAAGAPAANDASPVGKITEVVGDATVTHADGTHSKAEAGLAVHEGDVIETSAKGAVNILFSDNTTFAISESARMSVDHYTYDAQHHSGTSFFSMLQGVFVYTSGLIGKDDPGSVNIETPVGSIGIRGTVIAGDINPAGEPSTITIVDGAIVVTNGGGTLQMSSSFDTATLTSYSAAPVDSGTMTTQSFDTTYSAVAPVDSSFYSLSGNTTTTTSPDGTTASPDGTTTQPAPDATSPATTPDSMTSAQPAPVDSTLATAPADTTSDVVISDSTVQVPDAWNPMVTDTTVSLTDTTLMAPVSDTSFSTGTSGFGTTTTESATFTSVGTTTTTTTSTGGALLTAGGTTTTGGTTSTSGTTTTGGTTGGGGTTAPPPTAQFLFSDPYLNGTLGKTADDGLPLFGQLGASTFSSLPWGATGVPVGNVVTTGMVSPTFTLSGLGGAVLVPNGGGYDLIGDALQFNTVTTGINGDTVIQSGVAIMHLSIDAAGAVTLDFINPMGILPNIQTAPWSFSITATDSSGASVTTTPFVFQTQPMGLPGGLVTQFGDEQGAGSIDSFYAQGPANNLLFGGGGDDTLATDGVSIPATGSNVLIGAQGNDTLLWGGTGRAQMFGGDGNDNIVMTKAAFISDGFSLVDGGTGTDRLQVGSPSAAGQTFDFRTSNNVFNIEGLSLTGAASGINIVKLDFKDIFEMTVNDPSHTLKIDNVNGGYGTEVDIFGRTTELTGYSSFSIVDGSGNTITTITGTTLAGTAAFNNQSVTLIINQGQNPASGTADGIFVTVN